MNEFPGRKKILLHLKKEKDIDKNDPYSFFNCQEGIAEAVNLSQNRVSKLLEEMKETGFVKSESGKVEGCPQRRNTYFLTDEGEKKADQIKRSIGKKDIKIKTENGISRIKLSKIKEYVKGPNPLLFAANNFDQKGILDLTDLDEEDIFVDREEEMKLLKDKIGKVEDENTNAVLIQGPPGVGKTRLIKEIKRFAVKRGIELYEEKGVSEIERPYRVFKDLFSDILENSGEDEVEKTNILDMLDDEKNIDRIIDEVRKLLDDDSKKPLTIIVDDLQSVDRESLRLFNSIAEEARGIPLLLLGARRTTGVERNLVNKKLAQIDGLSVLSIETFDWKHTRKLLIRKIGRRNIPDRFINMMQKVTLGVPLFIDVIAEKMLDTEVLDPIKGIYPKNLDGIEVPEEIKVLYKDKIEKLNEREKILLNICSCFEEDISKDQLLGTIEVDKEIDDLLENLQDKGLLKVSSGNKINFAHPLIRVTIYESLGEKEKKELHRRIAESLKELNQKEDSDYYFMLARHHEEGSMLEESVRFYKKAAKEAGRNYENEKGIHIYEKILEIKEENDVQNVKESKIHEKISDLLRRKDEYRKAIDYLKSIEKKDQELLDLVRIQRKQAECLRNVREYDKAVDLIKEGMEDIAKTDQLNQDFKKEKCKLLKERGMIYLRKNKYDEAKGTFLKMKRLSLELDSKEDKAEAIHYLGSIDYYKSDFYEARDKLKRAINIREDVDDLKGLSASYTNLGVVHRRLQNLRKSLEYHKKANGLEKEIGCDKGDPAALTNIGIVYEDLAEFDKALEYYNKCLNIEKEQGDKHGVASNLDNMGVLYSKKGEFDKAIEYHKESLNKKKELENRLGESYSYYNLGAAYREKGDFDQAVNYLEKSREIRKELEDRLNLGYSELDLGITYLRMLELSKSEKYLEKALDLFRETKTDHGMGLSLAYLGKLKVMNDSIDEGEKFLTHSEKIKSEVIEPRFDLILERILAEYHLEKNRLEKALAYCKKSIKRAKKAEMSNELGKGKKLIGKILSEKGMDWKAIEVFRESADIFEETGDKKSKADVLINWSELLKDKNEEEASEKISLALELIEECGLMENYVKRGYLPKEELS